MIYSPVNYQLGDVPDPTSKAKARAELVRMRSSLEGYLKNRKMVDQIISGKRRGRTPPRALKLRMQGARAGYEQKLASDLYGLLSECFAAASLPLPDLTKDPNAAVKLAEIAVSGRLPEESSTPGAQGIVWMWPLVIVVGGISWIITSKIRSDAEVAKEQERAALCREGVWVKCVDTGFLLGLGAAAIGAWVVWDKFGLRKKFGK